ncbi:hypothetical protein DO70_5399 [Burkholderia pseudomallei]|nr:hypothetical protein DO70_5399 [Burkholderia pseudomallei]
MSRLAREHDCLRDVRMRFEHRLNLLGLDANAVHLHLEVGAAEIMEAPLEVVAHPIAGPIQARAGGGGERIGDETLRGQRRPPMVAVRDADAADVELARHVGGHRIQACVEHVQMRVRDRPVQIDFAVLERARDVDPVDDAADRAFARPVDVVERDAPRRRAMPLANRLERDLFAADADEPHRAEPGRAAVGRQMLAQHAPVRGGQREDADPLRTAGVDERRHRALDVLVADVQRSARAQRREDLLERRVERERREQHRAVAARIAEAFDDRADVVDDAAMMEHRRLRRARRARRVGEEHAVIGRRLGGRRGCVARVPRRAVERRVSTGKQIAPALIVAMMPSTASTLCAASTPTTMPGRTPSSRRTAASASVLRASAAKLSVRAGDTSAGFAGAAVAQWATSRCSSAGPFAPPACASTPRWSTLAGLRSRSTIACSFAVRNARRPTA